MIKVMNRQKSLANLSEMIKQSNCPYSCIIGVFWEMLERNANSKQNLFQSVSIDVGKNNNKGFQSFLHSSFSNPLVNVQYFSNEPQLRISSFDKHNGGSVTLNLTMLENIVVKENRVGDSFLTYDVKFHYNPANMDYMIHVIARNI